MNILQVLAPRSLVAIAVVFAVNSLHGQTISTNPLSVSIVYPGDTVAVSYSTSGTFDAKNSFTVQLSDATGSFVTYKNIGSISKVTTSGVILAVIPVIAEGNGYRIRVISSLPYSIGSDNGSDITLGANSVAAFLINDHRPNKGGRYRAAFIGDTINVINNSTGAASYLWDFGEGAIPATSTDAAPGPIVYTTPGKKSLSLTITSPTGHTSSYSYKPVEEDNAPDTRALNIFSCSTPIPSIAQVDSISQEYPFDNGVVWVMPGVTMICNLGGKYTIFAEPGSSVHSEYSSSTIYLLAGASYTGNDANSGIIVADNGASLDKLTAEVVLRCSGLSFDYTDAPPRPQIFSGVSEQVSSGALSIYPNPTSNMLYIEADDIPKEVALYNSSGKEVLHAQDNLTSKLQIAVGDLASGTYRIVLNYGNRTDVRTITISH